MIGLNVSPLIRDNGSLQIGIGSLGNGIASSLIMRHKDNKAYTQVLSALNISGGYADLIEKIGGTGTFKKGLYGATEMLVDVFIELYKNGILKRKVYDHAGVQKLLNEKIMGETITPQIFDIFMDHHIIHERLTKADFRLLMKYGVIKGPLEYMDGCLICKGISFPADLREEQTREMLTLHLGDRLQEGVVCHPLCQDRCRLN